MRAERKALTKERRSSETRQVIGRIIESQEYQKSGVIVSYMALGSELDLTELNEKVLADGKKLVLPVVKGKDLIFREVKGAEA